MRIENMMESISWSKLYSYRLQIRKSYPSVYRIKIKKRLLDIIIEELKDFSKILDVGAHNRKLGEYLLKINPTIIYKSMDIDKSLPHDYYNLNDINENFDIIILSEVIEHIHFEEGVRTLQKLRELLNEDGKIIISIPNVDHPNRFFRDITHKVPYRYDELGAVLLYIGFNVNKIFRIYNEPFFKRLFRIYCASHLHRYLDVDFAPTVVVVASRK